MLRFLPLIATAAAASSFNVPGTLGDHVDRAKDSSGIAVLLPETIRSEFDKLYPSSNKRPQGGYDLILGAAKNCNGASVCGVATFQGDEDGKRLEKGKKVDLAKGRTGRYVKSTCAANCSFPYIQWRERGSLYTIAYKESRGRKNMVKLANSAIRNGPR